MATPEPQKGGPAARRRPCARTLRGLGGLSGGHRRCVLDGLVGRLRVARCGCVGVRVCGGWRSGGAQRAAHGAAASARRRPSLSLSLARAGGGARAHLCGVLRTPAEGPHHRAPRAPRSARRVAPGARAAAAPAPLPCDRALLADARRIAPRLNAQSTESPGRTRAKSAADFELRPTPEPPKDPFFFCCFFFHGVCVWRACVVAGPCRVARYSAVQYHRWYHHSAAARRASLQEGVGGVHMLRAALTSSRSPRRARGRGPRGGGARACSGTSA